jgi:hypothetical protein
MNRTASGSRPGAGGGDVPPVVGYLWALFRQQPKVAEAYVLTNLCGCRVADAAQILDMTRDAVYKRRQRADAYFSEYTECVTHDGVQRHYFTLKDADAVRDDEGNVATRAVVRERLACLDDALAAALHRAGIDPARLLEAEYRTRHLDPLATKLREQMEHETKIRSSQDWERNREKYEQQLADNPSRMTTALIDEGGQPRGSFTWEEHDAGRRRIVARHRGRR